MANEPITEPWLREFVATWLKAWNSHEPEQLLALMTDDIVYHDDSRPFVMHGHDQVRDWLLALWHANPDLTFTVVGIYIMPGEPKAAIHWQSKGTLVNKLEPFGFRPTGRPVTVDGVDLHTYREGRISAVRAAFDMLEVARQAGLLPAAGGRLERLGAPAIGLVVRLFDRRPAP
ncbi:MAG: hypothetical protein QOD10_2698 [Mycobacterium sp.]|nr:hypothetical protein [Mycobacterium sp.]